MADSPSLAGLLDRVGRVFSLAGKLGQAFYEEHRGQGDQIDPVGWNLHAPDFDEYCVALLDLRDAMQNPPDGFASVAEPLLEAARIAKAIRDAMRRPEGRSWAAYLDFFPQLNSVSEDGWRAVKGVTMAWRLDDPFAFDDEGNANSSVQRETTDPVATPKKPKRSTERGEGRAKLIAALTKHHKYADGGCLNLEPIGNNELARLAGVSGSTAFQFFKGQFKGHKKYQVLCADQSRFVAALKLLNREFAPHHLYGAKPPGEGDRDDED